MDSFQKEMRDYNKKRAELDRAVLNGEVEPPCCFTCKAPSTHVTDGITPAGYRAYQCAAHAPKTKAPLWGSDPGWSNDYLPIAEARRVFQDRKTAAQ